MVTVCSNDDDSDNQGRVNDDIDSHGENVGGDGNATDNNSEIYDDEDKDDDDDDGGSIAELVYISVPLGYSEQIDKGLKV